MFKNVKNWTRDVVVGGFLIVVGVFSFPVGGMGKGFLDTQLYSSASSGPAYIEILRNFFLLAKI